MILLVYKLKKPLDSQEVKDTLQRSRRMFRIKARCQLKKREFLNSSPLLVLLCAFWFSSSSFPFSFHSLVAPFKLLISLSPSIRFMCLYQIILRTNCSNYILLPKISSISKLRGQSFRYSPFYIFFSLKYHKIFFIYLKHHSLKFFFIFFICRLHFFISSFFLQ